MKYENFKVTQCIREFIQILENELENFPKAEIEIKNKVRMNSFEILELAYEANTTTFIDDKKKLIYKIVAKIKIIDFLLDMATDKKLLTEKKYYKLGLKLNDIIKLINGWLKTII